jgi:hypothetical protein
MKFSKSKRNKVFDWDLQKYFDYLKENLNYISPNLYNIITQRSYLDPSDHRCPHDGNLISVEISEQIDPLGSRFEGKLDCKIKLRGAYEDYEIVYTYKGIKRYSFNYPDYIYESTHGDWLIDRFLFSKEKNLIQLIMFSSKALFEIECKDINIEFVELSDS